MHLSVQMLWSMIQHNFWWTPTHPHSCRTFSFHIPKSWRTFAFSVNAYIQNFGCTGEHWTLSILLNIFIHNEHSPYWQGRSLVWLAVDDKCKSYIYFQPCAVKFWTGYNLSWTLLNPSVWIDYNQLSSLEFYDHLTEFLMSGSLTQRIYLEAKQIHWNW